MFELFLSCSIDSMLIVLEPGELIVSPNIENHRLDKETNNSRLFSEETEIFHDKNKNMQCRSCNIAWRQIPRHMKKQRDEIPSIELCWIVVV